MVINCIARVAQIGNTIRGVTKSQIFFDFKRKKAVNALWRTGPK